MSASFTCTRSHGVLPAALRAAVSAPASSITLITAGLLLSSAARCRGVPPYSSRASKFAPACSSAVTASALPAKCSGVQPPPARSFGSAPASRQRITSETSAGLKKSLVFQFAQSTCARTGTASATATVAVTRQLIGFMIASRAFPPFSWPRQAGSPGRPGWKWWRAWGEASRIDRLDRAAQARHHFTYGNQIAALTLHGLFSHLPQTAPKPSSRKEVSIDDYSTWRAVRFADPDEIG